MECSPPYLVLRPQQIRMTDNETKTRQCWPFVTDWSDTALDFRFSLRRHLPRQKQFVPEASLDLRLDYSWHVVCIESVSGGPGITRSDLLVINKIDLAPMVGANLRIMEADTVRMRGKRPFVFSNLKSGEGVEPIANFIIEKGGLAKKAA